MEHTRHGRSSIRARSVLAIDGRRDGALMSMSRGLMLHSLQYPLMTVAWRLSMRVLRQRVRSTVTLDQPRVLSTGVTSRQWAEFELLPTLLSIYQPEGREGDLAHP